jgi:16S rRNA (adenine1518-N6/adenine1519-N6)-dimethyltransferase
VPPIRRRFGQNFLTDQNALSRIVDALQLDGDECVVEVGPGRGALTDHLIARCRNVVCIEIDRDLVGLLRQRYADRPGVRIVEGDVLDADFEALTAGQPWVLAGNVPYYITTPIIFHALRPPMPRRAVFLIQREVADRLHARPGSRTYGALTVNVAFVARVVLVSGVSAGSFHPKPKVDSAIVRFEPIEVPLVPLDRLALARAFVTALFGQRRRQLVRALRTVTGASADVAQGLVESAGLAPAMRPEELSPVDFARLHEIVVTAR